MIPLLQIIASVLLLLSNCSAAQVPPQVCKRRINSDQCPFLMRTVKSAMDWNCECYNFCNGKLVSCRKDFIGTSDCDGTPGKPFVAGCSKTDIDQGPIYSNPQKPPVTGGEVDNVGPPKVCKNRVNTDHMKPSHTSCSDCECYNFCNGKFVSCGPDFIGTEECDGSWGKLYVAGCGRQDLEPRVYSNPTVPVSGGEVENEQPPQGPPQVCHRRVNTHQCHFYMSLLSHSFDCDCYNFCNGKLVHCGDGFIGNGDCDGTFGRPYVAGCTKADRFGPRVYVGNPNNQGSTSFDSVEGSGAASSSCCPFFGLYISTIVLSTFLFLKGIDMALG